MVRLDSCKGLFKVVRVNRKDGTVDVMHRVGKQDVVERNVPLSVIRTVPLEAFHAIQKFLGSRSSRGHRGRMDAQS